MSTWCPKHVEAWNKLIVKLIVLRYMVSKTSKNPQVCWLYLEWGMVHHDCDTRNFCLSVSLLNVLTLLLFLSILLLPRLHAVTLSTAAVATFLPCCTLVCVWQRNLLIWVTELHSCVNCPSVRSRLPWQFLLKCRLTHLPQCGKFGPLVARTAFR